MHDPNDYQSQTWREREAEDRARQEEWTEEFERRMEAFDAGLCSLGAAVHGGAHYERDLAESALELREEAGVAGPIAAAVNGWIRAITAARKAA